MRGILDWVRSVNGDKVDFVRDENGYWEITEKGIIPYHKSAVDDFIERRNFLISPQAKQETNTPNQYDEWAKDFIEQEDNTPKEDTQKYVITAFQGKSFGVIWKLRENGIYSFDGVAEGRGCDAEYLLKELRLEIYSVQRKSDNETFTVDEITEQGKIVGFVMTAFQNEKYIDVRTDDNGVDRRFHISKLTKKRDAVMVDMDAVLFTLRDVIDTVRNNMDWERKLLELANDKNKDK